MKNLKFKMKKKTAGAGPADEVWAYTESVFGAPSRRGNFSLGGGPSRTGRTYALPLPPRRKSLWRTARWALLGFVGPLNLKIFLAVLVYGHQRKSSKHQAG
ncbi:MAG: hypothetical protein JF609_02180 [Verrucomicrobia bacterium]|nr:hypothetical protein [Verrucomicrobiota bacterium]